MDLVTIGESMVLFTPTSSGPLRFSDRFNRTLGGAESNVAIALSRLGHKTGWISRLGNDEFGYYIRNFIRGEGVDTSNIIFDQENPTGLFFKEMNPGQDPSIYYYRKSSAASNLSPKDLNEEYISKARFIHLTGITPGLSESCKQAIYRIIELAKKNKQVVVFDPNIRLKLWSKKEAANVLADIARKCDIVLAGLDEGQTLTGKDTPEQISQSLLQGETKVVVVKIGEKGSYMATQNEQHYIPGVEVSKVIDTAGAGDGFAAGFLSGLIRGWDYRNSAELGNRVGAYALSVAGDVEGYPYWHQVNPLNSANKVLR